LRRTTCAYKHSGRISLSGEANVVLSSLQSYSGWHDIASKNHLGLEVVSRWVVQGRAVGQR
jgi:hypothetical protein